MTRNELCELERAIRSEKLESSSAPFAYGIERAVFEQSKYKRLIAAAKQVDWKTAQTKLAKWQRQLKRAIKTQVRFEKMRNELGLYNSDSIRDGHSPAHSV